MIWFTSDTHFWHRNVIQFCQRPWATVEDMNQGLIDGWNRRVADDDDVFVLGDFAFCGSTEIRRIVGELRGNKHLVMGNHDWKYRPDRWLEFGFRTVTRENAMAVDGDRLYLMSHFPYRGAGDHMTEERYAEHRMEDTGKWLLHGHVHNAWRHRGRMFNVGVDRNNYEPVSADEIKGIADAVEKAGCA